MQAVMKRSSWFKSDVNVNLPFKVDGRLNLTSNMISNLNRPVQIEKRKTICDLLCRVGQIGFTLKLNRSIYVPGEFINFNAYLENYSSQKLRRMTIKLIQVVEFIANGSTRKEICILDKVKGPKLQPGREDVWSGNDVLKIPLNSLPSELGGGCRIMNAYYVLRVCNFY